MLTSLTGKDDQKIDLGADDASPAGTCVVAMEGTTIVETHGLTKRLAAESSPPAPWP